VVEIRYAKSPFLARAWTSASRARRRSRSPGRKSAPGGRKAPSRGDSGQRPSSATGHLRRGGGGTAGSPARAGRVAHVHRDDPAARPVTDVDTWTVGAYSEKREWQAAETSRLEGVASRAHVFFLQCASHASAPLACRLGSGRRGLPLVRATTRDAAGAVQKRRVASFHPGIQPARTARPVEAQTAHGYRLVAQNPRQTGQRVRSGAAGITTSLPRARAGGTSENHLEAASGRPRTTRRRSSDGCERGA